MKIKYEMFAVVAIAAIGIILLTGCKTSSTEKADGEQFIPGTNLKLVAEYKPFHLYVYADTASTNKFPDYAIFKKHELVFEMDNESNTVVTTHFEHGLGVLTTERDKDGNFLRRYFNVYDGKTSQDKYFYVATNEDDQWDRFVIYGTNAESIKAFVRSNLCWVPIAQK